MIKKKNKERTWRISISIFIIWKWCDVNIEIVFHANNLLILTTTFFFYHSKIFSTWEFYYLSCFFFVLRKSSKVLYSLYMLNVCRCLSFSYFSDVRINDMWWSKIQYSFIYEIPSPLFCMLLAVITLLFPLFLLRVECSFQPKIWYDMIWQ